MMAKMTISDVQDELITLSLQAGALLNAMDELRGCPSVFDAYQLIEVRYAETDARINAINEALEKTEVVV